MDMSTPDRPRPWLPPISLVTIALIIWLVSFSPWRFDPFRVTGQACLLIITLRAFCYWPPMVRWVTSMSVPHRAIFALILASMIYGHYTINSRTNYPFITWFIFPSVIKEDPVTCPEFIATTESGKKVRLLVEQLFPSIIQVDRLDDYPPETLEHLARALAKVYNEHHADDPARQVDLFIMAVKLHPPPNESRTQPSCEFLQRYDISSGR